MPPPHPSPITAIAHVPDLRPHICSGSGSGTSRQGINIDESIGLQPESSLLYASSARNQPHRIEYVSSQSRNPCPDFRQERHRRLRTPKKSPGVLDSQQTV